jgi:hypothetical protein
MAAYHPVVNDHHATSWQTYRIVWVACCVVSTLYSTWWDLVMDWGFLSRDSLWPGLRRELLYGEHNAHWYYAAMLSNCLLRWVWVLTIVPFSFEENDGDPESPTNILTALVSWDKVLIPVLALLELLRRFQWAIFRVEYEQIVQGTKLRVDPHLVRHNAARRHAGAAVAVGPYCPLRLTLPSFRFRLFVCSCVCSPFSSSSWRRAVLRRVQRRPHAIWTSVS